MGTTGTGYSRRVMSPYCLQLGDVTVSSGKIFSIQFDSIPNIFMVNQIFCLQCGETVYILVFPCFTIPYFFLFTVYSCFTIPLFFLLISVSQYQLLFILPFF